MGFFLDALNKVKKAFGSKSTEGSTQPCPLKETGLLVMVVRDDTQAAIPEAIVDIKGKAPFHKKSDSEGIALFKPVEPDTYTVTATLPSSLKNDLTPPEATQAGVPLGECPIHIVHVQPLVPLKIKVVQRGNLQKTFPDATVEIVSGPAHKGVKKTAAGQEAVADFGSAPTGEYTVKVTLTRDDDKKKFLAPDEAQAVSLVPVGTGPLLVYVDALNVVTPKLEAEYKVVLLEPDLAKHQDPAEEKIVADPTRVELSLIQTNPSNPLDKPARFKCSPANVEVFLDEECKTKAAGDPAAGIPLKPELFDGGKKVSLYLRGKTAGKFTATFELEDPGRPSIRLDKKSVKEDMGVVRLQMVVHQHDFSAINAIDVDPDTDPIDTYYTNLKNQDLPEQKALTDEQKVKTGRTLHVQKDSNHGRAKLVVKKIDASHWPDGADDYEIYLNRTNTSGAVAVFDAEWDGAEKKFPVKIKLADLKSADQVLWIEGKSATAKRNDVRLDLTLDRPEGGPAKEAKRNADWARFTVVQIKEVKIDYKAPAGKASAWDESKERFYINLKSGSDGRKITIGARLSEKVAKVKVHFMLAPDKNNMKAANWGRDLPGTWKWKDISPTVKHNDKANRKKILHLSAETDAEGYAKVELTLSRFGGDKFHPAAYIDQDPHLAKYVAGHPDLEKKKPIFAEKSVTVWRKFWYRLVKVEGISVPSLAPAIGQYANVRAEMTAGPEISISRADVNGFNPRAIYPMYMVRVNGGNADALVISDSNKHQFFTGYSADPARPVEIPIVVCDAQWDAGGNTAAVSSPTVPASSFPIELRTDKLMIDPPLQGGSLLVSGTWVAGEWDPAAGGGAGGWTNVRSGALTPDLLSINPSRDDLRKVRIALPAGVGAVTPQTRVQIKDLVCQGANGPYLGESFNKRILAVYEPKDELHRNDFQNTIVHEIGHAFNQVIKGDPAGGIAGIPKHPHQKDKGQGNHCRYLTNKCVMYDSGPIVGSLNRYCDVCHPYLLVQDMTRIT